jgi:putative ABC transport system permease protein
MSWIALKMLVGDRAKFFGIVLGVTFAALLITQQGSIFCGLMLRTAGQIYDITGADLWVMDANVRYIDDVKPMVENNLYRLRGVRGVKWAVPLYKGNARAKINSLGIDPETKRPKKYEVIEQVILLGVDDASMVGAPPREKIFVGELRDLRKPDAVIIDCARLRKLYPGEDWDLEPGLPGDRERILEVIGPVLAKLGLGSWRPEKSLERQLAKKRHDFYERFVGRELEMNDHRAIIVGVCEATRTFQSNAVVYTTYSRAKNFAPQERKVLSYILAKAEDDVPPGVVIERIKAQTGLQSRTSHDFIQDTFEYYLKYTGIPINFGITVLLGFLVGTAIAGQTFYNFTLENIKQFGALKAMGTTNGRVVGMILLQAAVVGLLGYGIGVGLAALFGYETQGGELAYFTPWQILPITFAAVFLICILSSILSVRRVIVLEPAVVFRG